MQAGTKTRVGRAGGISVVKSTCSCRGFCFGDPHGSSRLSITPAQKDLAHSSAHHRHHMHKMKTPMRHHLLHFQDRVRSFSSVSRRCQTHLTRYMQRMASVHTGLDPILSSPAGISFLAAARTVLHDPLTSPTITHSCKLP